MMRRNEKGFTLIELMIVVAIIGILAAIAIPNFRNYQLKAKRGELPTNLKAIKTAEVAFQAENDYFQALTATPATAPTTIKGSWSGAGLATFQNIGWQPSGDVYGQYSTTAVAGSFVNGIGTSDIDGDTTLANYSFYVDVATPGNDHDVEMQSNNNDF